MQDVNNRENCRVEEVGGARGIRKFFVLSIQFSVNLKLLQKQFYWFFLMICFVIKRKALSK